MTKKASKKPAAAQDVRVIEQMAVDKLIPYSGNARTHSDAQIAKLAGSLIEFGFQAPVLIDEKNVIMVGHGRVAAARKIDMKTVPCVRVTNLSDAQKRAYIIADNRMALDADWDDELLRAELEKLREEDFDLAFTGFDEDELNKICPVEVYSEGGPEPEVPVNSFGIFVECTSEAQQMELYDDFGRRGIKCKIMN